MSIDVIVLDGGPCGGKTSGMVHLCEVLVQAGIMPMVIPEAATMLISSGVTPSDIGDVEFQKRVLELQLAHETVFRRAAIAFSRAKNVRVVVLADRGIMSGAAYLSVGDPLSVFIRLFPKDGPSSYEVVMRRYAGIIHVASAADGAEKYYTLANNPARRELTIKDARAADLRIRRVWLGHPKLTVVGNRDEQGCVISFAEKMKRTEAAMWRMLGLPEPVEIEDKYKLRSFDSSKLPVPFELVDIVQMYLTTADATVVERVRSRTWRGATSYIHTTKRPRDDGGVFEVENYVSEREYAQLLARIDTSRRPIEKKRYCFLFNDQYFEVDVFGGVHEGLVIAEREKTSLNEATQIPDFLDVECEVTNDRAYSNWSLARS